MEAETGAEGRRTTTEREGDRTLVVTRRFEARASLVFEAWTRPDLFRRWWAPRSFGVTVVSFEAEIRTGGTYRLAMGHQSAPEPMVFFGRYVEVTAPSRLVWTNDEAGGQGAVTTVTFEDGGDGTTLVTVRELFPSAAALEEAVASGSTGGWGEQFTQLDAVLAGGAGG